MVDRTERAGGGAAPQRGEDRRDSQRVPVRLMVRDLALGGSFEERPGNLSLGGVFYLDGHPPQGNRVELRFVLPGTRHEVRARGEVLRVTREGARFGAHVRFTDLPLPSELAIARFLQRG
jgi:uncharacterized protein (TIGR02266 family)